MNWNKHYKKGVLEDLRNGWLTNPIIIKGNGKIEPNYGLEEIVLTDEHINALKEGKAIWFPINGNEYAGIIMHSKSLGGIGERR